MMCKICECQSVDSPKLNKRADQLSLRETEKFLFRNAIATSCVTRKQRASFYVRRSAITPSVRDTERRMAGLS